MTKRKSVILPSETMSRKEAEEVFASYAKADASLEKTTAAMDLEIAKVREKYQAKIEADKSIRTEAESKLMLFCTQNKDELFIKKKSIEMAHGEMGFRTGTPALKPKKGFTLASCLELAKKFLPDYVRTKEELDREALIAARSIDGMVDKYDSIGCQIVQEEKWFIELKKELVAD